MKTSKTKVTGKRVILPTFLVVGVLLSSIIISSPLEYTFAQQQQQITAANANSSITEYGGFPQINGSVSVKDGIENFLSENTKTPFITAAQTAQNQISNGTILGGHIGVIQGYLTYTYFVASPTNDTAHKVIVDAGNGQVLYTSEGKQMGSWNQPMFGPFGHEKGHGFGEGSGNGFGGFLHGLFGQ
jgi:uncharacterized membrane protein YkoI